MPEGESHGFGYSLVLTPKRLAICHIFQIYILYMILYSILWNGGKPTEIYEVFFFYFCIQYTQKYNTQSICSFLSFCHKKRVCLLYMEIQCYSVQVQSVDLIWSHVISVCISFRLCRPFHSKNAKTKKLWPSPTRKADLFLAKHRTGVVHSQNHLHISQLFNWLRSMRKKKLRTKTSKHYCYSMQCILHNNPANSQ